MQYIRNGIEPLLHPEVEITQFDPVGAIVLYHVGAYGLKIQCQRSSSKTCTINAMQAP